MAIPQRNHKQMRAEMQANLILPCSSSDATTATVKRKAVRSLSPKSDSASAAPASGSSFPFPLPLPCSFPYDLGLCGRLSGCNLRPQISDALYYAKVLGKT